MNPKIYGQFNGEAGIYQTLSMMRTLVNQAMLNPLIRERAASLIIGCSRDLVCQENSIARFVHDSIPFVRDPSGVEALHDPVTFYEMRLRQGLPVYGDCDDHSTYLAALLKSIGHLPRFRVVGKANTFHHVHIVCDGNMLDTTFDSGEYPTDPQRAIQVDI